MTAREHETSLRRSHLLAPALVAAGAAALVPLRPLRALARGGLLLYAITVVVSAGKAARRDGDPAAIPRVAAALVIMHGAWGAGFLVNLLRRGVPVAALTRAATGGRVSPRTIGRSRTTS
jgi:hypothetical protein